MNNDLSEVIQGYIPTLTNHKSGKAKVLFVAFKGELVKDFMQALCLPTFDEAYAAARREQRSIWDLVSATPLDGNCELVTETRASKTA